MNPATITRSVAHRLPAEALTSALIATLACTAAFLAGMQIADGSSSSKLFGVLIALCFVPLVLFHLPLAVALWVPLLFFSGLPGFTGAERVAIAAIGVAWLLGRLGGARQGDRTLHPGLRRLLVAAAVFAIWLALSAAWAENLSLVGDDLGRWYSAMGMFVVIATSVVTARDAKTIGAAFVLGAAVSLAIGFWAEELTSSASHLERAVIREGRLHGAEFDPNLLAAGLVPSALLALGILAASTRRLPRLAMAGLIAFFAAGLIATQSRGGFIAGLTALGATALLMKGGRSYALLLVVLAISAGGAQLAASPDAAARLFSLQSDEGNGRVELWRVGARIVQEHPILGVGLNNFVVESPRYARDVGSLEYVENITDSTKVVHNTYLQVLSETGAVGLALFLTIVTMCLHAGWTAARAFEWLGRRALATLSRSVVLATFSMLVASTFLSNGFDKRLWVLLALGPALLGVSAQAKDRPGLHVGSPDDFGRRT